MYNRCGSSIKESMALRLEILAGKIFSTENVPSSYIIECHFRVKYNEEYSELKNNEQLTLDIRERNVR